MVDAMRRLGRDEGFGVECDARCRLEATSAGRWRHHRRRWRLGRRCRAGLRSHAGPRLWRPRAENGLGDATGKPAALGEKVIGAILVKAETRSDRVGKDGETAGDQDSPSAVGAHGREQGLAPGSEGDALFDHFGDNRLGQAGQQGDAFAQGCLEGDLAIHRPRGDSPDALFDTHLGGQFVDAFLVDHGGVHVGQQNALAPSGVRLHHAVDVGLGGEVAQSGLDGIACEHCDGKIDREAAVEPDGDRRIHAEDRRSLRDGIGRKPAARGRGDQGGDEHGDNRSENGAISGDPDSRADRERQVGTGDGSCRTPRRRPSSMPIPCRSSTVSKS